MDTTRRPGTRAPGAGSAAVGRSSSSASEADPVSAATLAARFLEEEARALLTRLARVKPFALLTPAVPAASVTVGAQSAIESYLATGRQELRARVTEFLRWI